MASVRGDTARLRERVDALAHGADAGLRAVDGKVDRVKSSVRGAKVRSCLLPAPNLRLYPILNRVVCHRVT
jgi:hypothetical protein